MKAGDRSPGSCEADFKPVEKHVIVHRVRQHQEQNRPDACVKAHPAGRKERGRVFEVVTTSKNFLNEEKQMCQIRCRRRWCLETGSSNEPASKVCSGVHSTSFTQWRPNKLKLTTVLNAAGSCAETEEEDSATKKVSRTLCGKHRCKAPPDMLTRHQFKHVCAEKCPPTMRHMANAAVDPAEEQEYRALLETFRWGADPGGRKQNSRRSTRVHRQADH